jgi:hypothetical protein
MATPPTARSLTQSDGVALREYLEAKLDGQVCLIQSRIMAVERANDLAGKVLEERLVAINTRSDVNARAIDDLKTFRDRLDGKASQQSVILATILGLAGLIFGVVDLLMKLLA